MARPFQYSTTPPSQGPFQSTENIQPQSVTPLPPVVVKGPSALQMAGQILLAGAQTGAAITNDYANLEHRKMQLDEHVRAEQDRMKREGEQAIHNDFVTSEGQML